ncbi:MAG: nucleoside hydrolase [Bacteroidota bacterium]
MRRPLLILLLFLIVISAGAHSGKAKYHLIIDTDGAPDDLRAICLFLSSGEYEILAITCSDGAIKGSEAYRKVRSLLDEFGHQGIPVSYSENAGFKKQDWYESSLQTQWGVAGKKYPEPALGASSLIIDAMQKEKEKVTLVALGGLTNYAEALKSNPELANGIDRIVWYNDKAEPLSGINYEIDRKAAGEVLHAGIPVVIVGGSIIPFSGDIYTATGRCRSVYAKKIIQTHNASPLREKVAENHLCVWDDLLPVYLTHPEYFSVDTIDDHCIFVYCSDEKGYLKEYTNLLDWDSGKEGKVFSLFPADTSLYRADVRPYVNSIIADRGMEEFRCGVLTNELHGHLGIYAVIGMKMGLRARQYFKLGIDDIMILSYAGSVPPVSCMNDGLQVSTGGTLGHGLISISDEEMKRPEACFTFKGRTICLKLKEEYAAQISEDVKKGIAEYGDLTPAYWQHIRELALKYWAEWDRMEIFEITKQ